jgi:alpha-glucuronidase
MIVNFLTIAQMLQNILIDRSVKIFYTNKYAVMLLGGLDIADTSDNCVGNGLANSFFHITVPQSRYGR